MLDEKEITDAGWQQFFTQVGGFYNIKKYNDRYSTECFCTILSYDLSE